MASKSKYVKLVTGVSAPLTRRGSLMGAKVVGEWNEDGKRWLLFERTVEVGSQKKAPAKRKVNAGAKVATAAATTFPGTTESANG